MEVNRRTGIGALLGGIFAGPQVAKAAVERSMSEAVQEVAQYRYKGVPVDMPSTGTMAEKAAYQEEHLIRNTRARMKYLKRVINGDLSAPSDNGDEEAYYALEYGPYESRIDTIREYVTSLKSVSNCAKAHIEHRYRDRQHIERCKEMAKSDLDRMVKTWAKNKLWGKFSDLFK